jgi:hypothetical protein
MAFAQLRGIDARVSIQVALSSLLSMTLYLSHGRPLL